MHHHSGIVPQSNNRIHRQKEETLTNSPNGHNNDIPLAHSYGHNQSDYRAATAFHCYPLKFDKTQLAGAGRVSLCPLCVSCHAGRHLPVQLATNATLPRYVCRSLLNDHNNNLSQSLSRACVRVGILMSEYYSIVIIPEII